MSREKNCSSTKGGDQWLRIQKFNGLITRFNPWIGCSRVTEGCRFCYAEADMDKRRGRVQWGPNGTRSRTSDDNWRKPIVWNKWRYHHVDCGQELSKPGHVWQCPIHGDCCNSEVQRVEFDPSIHERRRVFCSSLADVFEDWEGLIVNHRGEQLWWDTAFLPADSPKMFSGTETPENELSKQVGVKPVTMNDLRADLFRLIDATPNLDWLLLTKRPESVRRMWPEYRFAPAVQGTLEALLLGQRKPLATSQMYRRNVWIGCSVSDQETADVAREQLKALRDLTPVLFVSYEPALGPVNWTGWEFVQQLISGGESGPMARLCDAEWLRTGNRWAQTHSIASFIKQIGANIVDSDAMAAWPVRCIETHPQRPQLKHPKGGDPFEWPADLRVREFPTVEAVVEQTQERGTRAAASMQPLQLTKDDAAIIERARSRID